VLFGWSGTGGVFLPERLDLTPWITVPTLYAFMMMIKQERGCSFGFWRRVDLTVNAKFSKEK
jgi:hypothetical protein